MGGSFVNNMIEYDAEYKKTPDILHMQKICQYRISFCAMQQ